MSEIQKRLLNRLACEADHYVDVMKKYHVAPLDPAVDRFSFRITKNEADFLLAMLRTPQEIEVPHE